MDTARWRTACALAVLAVAGGLSGARADLIAAGTPAPDFTLSEPGGGTFRMADHVGRHNVVVALLLETVCGYCSSHTAALTAQRAKWAADHDAVVVLVKPDTADAVKQFAGKRQGEDLPPIFIDVDKVVPKAYGVGTFQFHGGERYLPATFVIDKAGVVRATYASRSNADRPSMDWITAELAKLPTRAEPVEGQPLAPFALPDENGKVHRLADHRDQRAVVLTFYPKDMTGGCTREACSIRDSKAAFEAVNAVVYGVSVDSEESHRQFIAKEQLNYTLLADPSKGYTRLLGLLTPGGVASRVTIVVDKHGVVRKVDRAVKVATHAQDLLPLLKQLAEEK